MKVHVCNAFLPARPADLGCCQAMKQLLAAGQLPLQIQDLMQHLRSLQVAMYANYAQCPQWNAYLCLSSLLYMTTTQQHDSLQQTCLI